jgi:hypothetical protein
MDKRRRIQDPLEEKESRVSSGIVAVGTRSDGLVEVRTPDLGGVTCVREGRCVIFGGFVVLARACGASCCR